MDNTSSLISTPLPVVHGSGQGRLESMAVFFQRRKTAREKALQHEAESVRQSRLQREKNAESQVALGRKGAKVFYWDELEPNIWIRVPAGRDNYALIWDDYAPTQRRYDSVSNEWDLCSLFDISAKPEVFDDDHEMNEDRDSSFEYMRCLHSVAQDKSARLLITDSVEDIAKFRLGFVASSALDVCMLSAADDWVWATKLLGCHGVDGSTELRSQFPLLSKDVLRMASAPIRCFDLHLANSRIHASWPLKITLKEIGQRYYFIHVPSDNPPPFLLATTSAVTVVEIVRRDCSRSLAAIMRMLAKCGVAFRTFMQGPIVELPAQTSRTWARLGFHPKDYNFDRSDYLTYVKERNSFLRTPRARAARMAGGILARLACDAVDDATVCSGPTENVMVPGGMGECLRVVHGHEGYWDDQLSEDEIDLICGVYEITSGTVIPLFA
ncbi:hypothetical protein MPER_12486 [Moniliophthora perniciosa FA553]|nr:hypothetical protein MPER_12486 [Moniliophthora perniciosa FA553]